MQLKTKFRTSGTTMAKLKNNFIILILFISGCKLNPTFEIKTYPPNEYTQFHVLNIGSQRITHECKFFNAKDDQNWRHHYYMYILNDKNEVITAQFPLDQDIDDCTNYLKKIEKILKKSDTVQMCLRGEFSKKYIGPEDVIIDFKSLGKYAKSFDSQYLDTICNSKQCNSNNETWIDTCPGFVQHYRDK